jgi:hypothetical protein
MVTRDGKAANPFHSLAALQKLAHHASFWSATALAVAFPQGTRSSLTSAIHTQLFWDAKQSTIGFSAPFLNHTLFECQSRSSATTVLAGFVLDLQA